MSDEYDSSPILIFGLYLTGEQITYQASGQIDVATIIQALEESIKQLKDKHPETFFDTGAIMKNTKYDTIKTK